MELLHARNSNENAKWAVEFSRIADGIEMGAEEKDF